MKGKYKRKKHWCSKCDRDIVEGGTKCGTCGNREYVSKIKQKEALIQIMREDEKDGIYENKDQSEET